MGIRRWEIPQISREQALELSNATGLPELLCAVLCARGYHTKEAAEAFLLEEDTLFNPFLLRDMDKAVGRIRVALEFGEQIAVYGDYDCDGMTATALLTNYLQSVGAHVFYYIPNREKEGYGLNKQAVDTLAQMGAQLIVTVDNGIAAHEEIAYAASLGIDVVVTDHHTPRDTLPEAVAVVNPHRADCESPYKELAGVGVAFKLVCALEETDGADLLEYYAELVALGTIADVMPLLGENRVVVKAGLRQMAETQNPGISALLEAAGQTGRVLSGESVAFGVIPRLNACGRMGSVDDAIELLLTDDPGYAAGLAQTLGALNEQRKNIESGILLEIEGIVAQNPQILEERVLVLSGKDWHHGVVGIVAAKMVEKYGKPCILFSVDGQEARGSGRSIEGFSLIEAITACAPHLTRYGGHTLAAGLTLPARKLKAFVKDIQEFAREHYPLMPVSKLPVDYALSPADMTPEAAKSLEYLEPLGEAMRAPLFLFDGIVLEGIYPTADKKHLRIKGCKDDVSFYAVYFRMSERDFPYRAGDVVDIVAGISAGEYNGKAQVSVKIRDLRLHNAPQEELFDGKGRYDRYRRKEWEAADAPEEMIPGREECAAVYRYLKKYGNVPLNAEELYCRIWEQVPDFCRLLVALDVFEDLGLICRADTGVQVVEDAPKVSIESSRIIRELQKGKLGE